MAYTLTTTRTLLRNLPNTCSCTSRRANSLTAACALAQRIDDAPLLLSQHDNQRQQLSTAAKPVAIPPQVPPKYYVPREERTETNSVFQFDPIEKDRLIKTSRDCPTRELNYTPERWRRHKDPWRRTRHLLSLFNSSPFQRLMLPDMAFTACIATGLSCYNVLHPDAQLLLDGAAMAGASTAIGLLAAFRLSASYGRYEEGRKFWGEINNSSRDLCGNALMWLHDSAEKDRMLKLIKAFPVGLQFHLNEKGGHYRMKRKDPNFEEQKYAEFYAELHDVYKDKRDDDDDFVQLCNTYHSGGHVPLAVTALMRSIIAQNKKVNAIYNKEMDTQVQHLVGSLGMCERVLRTPIPICFTRHTSRLFFFWSNLLPFCMYASLGPIGTLPGSLLVSYAVMGIGDIGVQLEEPFNIMPLRQYSDGIYDGINGIETSFSTASTVGNRNKRGTVTTNSAISEEPHDDQPELSI